jgi:DNA mismatch repair ATPase MutS
VIQQGYYYAVFDEDAALLEEEFGNETFKPSDKSPLQAGFPTNSIEKYIDDFEKMNLRYIIVAQVDKKDSNDPNDPKGSIIRKIILPEEGREF